MQISIKKSFFCYLLHYLFSSSLIFKHKNDQNNIEKKERNNFVPSQYFLCVYAEKKNAATKKKNVLVLSPDYV